MKCRPFIACIVVLLAAVSTAVAEGRTLISLRQSSATAAAAGAVKSVRRVRLNERAIHARRFSIDTPEGRFAGIHDRPEIAATLRSDSKKETALTQAGGLYNEQRKNEQFTVSRVARRGRSLGIYGVFTAGDKAYILRRVRGRTLLENLDKTALPGCGGTVETSDHATHASEVDTRVQLRSATIADITTVDVAIFYSAEAYAGAGGTNAAMVAEANAAVALANQAYVNSQVSQRLRLVYVQQVGAENGRSQRDVVAEVQNPSDGNKDEIHTLRAQYRADVVTYMVSEAAEYCGLGFQAVAPADTSFAQFAFNTVNRQCISNHSYVHELAHNMGSNHDAANAVGGGAFPFSYGHRFTGVSGAITRTIMAYSPGNRVNYFSNPRLTYDGRPLGTTSADNAQSLERMKDIVAAFSDRLTPPNSTPAPQPTAVGTPEGSPPTASPTPIPSTTPFVVTGPGVPGGAPPTFAPPPTTVQRIIEIKQLRASTSSGMCHVSARLIEAGVPADGIAVRLVDAKSGEIIKAKAASSTKLSLRVSSRKIRRRTLRLVADAYSMSRPFTCSPN